MVGRGAVNVTKGTEVNLVNGNTQSYFFDGDQYARINWAPEENNDNISDGPTQFASMWPSLKQAGFTKVDAILPIPGDTNTAYFFCGSQYARIKFYPGGSNEILGYVYGIGNWGSLVKAGFDHVDAALIVPGKTNQAYFFSGAYMCRVSFKETADDPDSLLDGPHLISEHWGGLGFNTVDSIVPHPTLAQAYVFSGTQGERISISDGTVGIEYGPLSAASYWNSLHEAGFY